MVILGSELRVQPNPTQDRHDGCSPARLRQTLGGRSGGPVSGLLHHHQGHDPDASIIGGSDSISIDATYDEIHAKEQSFEDYCFSIPAAKQTASAESIVVFPGGDTKNDYNGSITIRSDLIDWDAVYGKKYVYVHACVVYRTFGEVRHTSVCYYAQAGKTIGRLPFCDKGNRAD